MASRSLGLTGLSGQRCNSGLMLPGGNGAETTVELDDVTKKSEQEPTLRSGRSQPLAAAGPGAGSRLADRPGTGTEAADQARCGKRPRSIHGATEQPGHEWIRRSAGSAETVRTMSRSKAGTGTKHSAHAFRSQEPDDGAGYRFDPQFAAEFGEPVRRLGVG